MFQLLDEVVLRRGQDTVRGFGLRRRKPADAAYFNCLCCKTTIRPYASKASIGGCTPRELNPG